MIAGNLSQAARAMRGQLQGDDAGFRGVSTDSRSIAAEQLFFALRGPNFDGARYAAEALARGAAGVVTQAPAGDVLPSIAVDDTRAALGQLAADWRAQMPATVIGVTGSNGKTTLKELLASCLRPVASTLATEGNLNNDIGLPLMLLRLSAEHRFAVLEMGANHAGEIAYLASLAVPAIVVISNAGPAHLEGFGSLDGVANAKGEILCGSERPTAAVLNADDRYFDLWCSMASDLEVISFGYADNATVRIGNARSDGNESHFDLQLPGERISVRLRLAGSHNVLNAAAAAAVAHAAGLGAAQIRHGLQNARPVDGRLRPIPGNNGMQVYDDSYNANPASVVAAARFIASRGGESCLVLGDMGELGEDEADLHRQVGADIGKAGVDRFLATGPLSRVAVDAFGDRGEWFESLDALIARLRETLPAGASVLVKGSRSMRMERVVDALRASPATDGGR